MRALLISFLMPALVSVAFSQKPVKVVLLPVFDRITPPPPSAKEAYGKCDCGQLESSGHCSADRLFKPIDDTLLAATNLLNAQIDRNAPPPGMPKGMASTMNDPEFQKKLKNMSDDEKMKMAIEMSKSMTTQPQMYVVETPGVQDALNEATAIIQKRGSMISSMGSQLQAEAKRKQALEKNHAAVDEWYQQEEKKVPQLSTGEMSYPEPKAYKALQTKAIDKHLAIVNDELKAIGAEWQKDRDEMKAMYAPFEAKMAKIHFGADAKNSSTQIQLANAQRGMIETLSKLSGRSRAAYEDAAKWYARKVTIENQTY